MKRSTKLALEDAAETAGWISLWLLVVTIYYSPYWLGIWVITHFIMKYW